METKGTRGRFSVLLLDYPFRDPIVNGSNVLRSVIDSLGPGEVPSGDKMLYYGTDPESYITEHTLVYEDKITPQTVARCLVGVEVYSSVADRCNVSSVKVTVYIAQS